MKLAGSFAVVSGSSSGIGEATAKALARKGAHVALLARTRVELDRVANEIALGGGTAFVYEVDLSQADAATRTARTILDERGCPDILVNNAGAGRWLYTDETPPDEAVAMMALPYFGAFYLTAAFLPCMLSRKSGAIANVTSPASFAAWPGATGYTAARWAMRGFTQALRADLAQTCIRVMLVVSGEVSSHYWTHNPGTAQRLPRLGAIVPTLRPDDVGAAIARGLERDRTSVIVPVQLRVALALNSIWQWPMERLLRATGHRRSADLSGADQRPQP